MPLLTFLHSLADANQYLHSWFVDLQMVNITCRVLSRPSVEDLPTM
jgi:hypothetical protein